MFESDSTTCLKHEDQFGRIENYSYEWNHVS